MRTLARTFVVAAIMLAGVGLQAQTETNTKKEEFKVYGNCGMCEARIEKAAKSVEGVTEADWDKETKMVEVTYNPEMAELMDIHKAIAGVGHDTEEMKAEDKFYDDLPGCCKYTRDDGKEE